MEVVARLTEFPDGAMVKRDLYDYASVFKYEVVTVLRGKPAGPTIYVAHYNPLKPRAKAADKFVKGIGGDLDSFAAGQLHHLALGGTLDESYMGGVINTYFGKTKGPIYWALWTDAASTSDWETFVRFR